MKETRLYSCELKRHRQITPPLCAVCPRVLKCRAFRVWYRLHRGEYLDFVTDICRKFPDKYILEVSFMPEKQTFVQIVDLASGAIEKIVKLTEIEAMTPEEKLELSRNKNLFIVTHRLEPIVQVVLKKTAISEPRQFGAPIPQPEPKAKAQVPVAPPKTRRKK